MNPHRLLLVAALSISAQAQWLNYKEPGVPRTADGKPNLSAPAPKTADGKPDLSGVWMHEKTSPEEMKRLYGKMIEDAIAVDVPGMEIGTQHKYAFNILIDHKPEEGLVRPETLERMRRNGSPLDANAGCGNNADVVAAAGAVSFSLADLLSEPIKIVHAPRIMVVLYEVGNLHRQLYIDGRQLPEEFDLPAFNGYSAGRWEGDTLVIETAGFNDKTRLDAMGHPHSEALHVTERFRRRDFGHLDYEVTLDDPKSYTKPFTLKIPHDLMPDSDIFETYPENEKDRAHICKH
jgi:hypothetical protein